MSFHTTHSGSFYIDNNCTQFHCAIPSFQITKNPNSLAARGLLPSQRLGLTPSPVPFAGHRGLRPPRPQYNFCVFCKNNGEDEKFYMTHTLKDDGGLVRYAHPTKQERNKS